MICFQKEGGKLKEKDEWQSGNGHPEHLLFEHELMLQQLPGCRPVVRVLLQAQTHKLLCSVRHRSILGEVHLLLDLNHMKSTILVISLGFLI